MVKVLVPWPLLRLSSSSVLVRRERKDFSDSVLVLTKLLEWCVGLYFPVLLMEQCGQTWSGEVLSRFVDGGQGAGQCRAVLCGLALVWPVLPSPLGTGERCYSGWLNKRKRWK